MRDGMSELQDYFRRVVVPAARAVRAEFPDEPSAIKSVLLDAVARNVYYDDGAPFSEDGARQYLRRHAGPLLRLAREAAREVAVDPATKAPPGELVAEFLRIGLKPMHHWRADGAGEDARATPAQLALIGELGGRVEPTITRKAASALIDDLKARRARREVVPAPVAAQAASCCVSFCKANAERATAEAEGGDGRPRCAPHDASLVARVCADCQKTLEEKVWRYAVSKCGVGLCLTHQRKRGIISGSVRNAY